MRRRIAVAGLALVFAPVPFAEAGVPEPARAAAGIPCDLTLRSKWTLAPPPLPCQYRFRSDGALDGLRVILTLRDCFDTPIADFPVQASVTAAPDTPAFCACESADQVQTTDSVGAAEFVFRRIGGRGHAQVLLTSSPIRRWTSTFRHSRSTSRPRTRTAVASPAPR